MKQKERDKKEEEKEANRRVEDTKEMLEKERRGKTN